MGTTKKLSMPSVAATPFELIAISTMLSPSRLLLLLQHDLGWTLVRHAEAEHVLNRLVFADGTTLRPGVIALMPNKMDGGSLLVPQLPTVDYLLELSGFVPADCANKALVTLQRTTHVQAAIRVQPSSIKRNAPFWPV